MDEVSDWAKNLRAYGLDFLISDLRSWMEQGWSPDDIMAAISERADLIGTEITVLTELLLRR